jgi:hypothetical protein
MVRPLALLLIVCSVVGAEPAIEHTVFIAGSETGVLSTAGEVLWRYPTTTRDGSILPNGHALLALARSKD